MIPTEEKIKFLDASNLIYDAICILEPYYKKDAVLNKNFQRIFDYLTFAFDSYLFYNRGSSHGPLRGRVFALKENLYDKMMFILKDELSTPNLICEDSILDPFIVSLLYFFIVFI